MEWVLLILLLVVSGFAIVSTIKLQELKTENDRQNRLKNDTTVLEDQILSKQQELTKIQSKINQNQEEMDKLAVEMAHQTQNLNAIKDAAHQVEIQLAASRIEDSTLRSGYMAKSAALEAEYQTKMKYLSDTFEARIKALDLEYSNKAETYAADWEHRRALLEEEYNALLQSVHEQQVTLHIALEQNRQDHEDEGRHCLAMPDIDRYEIAELDDVCGHIRNPLPLCKAIYDIYYKVPTTNLINDLGVKGVSGIYKITDMTNGKMYVGQSVDLGERWRQHIKRGIGAETGTISGSKLYSAMHTNKLWNFKFELLEEVSKDSLNAREKFWISYFNSVEYGYNMKAGG